MVFTDSCFVVEIWRGDSTSLCAFFSEVTVLSKYLAVSTLKYSTVCMYHPLLCAVSKYAVVVVSTRG